MSARIGLTPRLLSATDEIQKKSRYNRLISIYQYSNLAPRLGGIKQNIENGLLLRATRLSEPPTVTEEELLTVLRKPNNIAYKSSDDHNMELDEQS